MARKGLGRGLESILGDGPHDDRPSEGGFTTPRGIAVADISPDPDQPRKHFDDAGLDELAASIKSRGLLQPILLRRVEGGPTPFVIIAGERRWRAATRAGLHEIPAVIRETDAGTTAELALIENLQRSDLNPIEEADAYARLRDVLGRKPTEIADAVGKSRSHVANMLRLTGLPDPVKVHVMEGRLSMGHARALLSADDPSALAERVIKRDLSVRETERLVQSGTKTPRDGEEAPAGQKLKPSSGSKDADTKSLERDLEGALGLSVAIEHTKKGGTVTLTYDTLDQLDDICRRLMGAMI
jgi:ParB family chromosome partitioning protein